VFGYGATWKWDPASVEDTGLADNDIPINPWLHLFLAATELWNVRGLFLGKSVRLVSFDCPFTPSDFVSLLSCFCINHQKDMVLCLFHVGGRTEGRYLGSMNRRVQNVG